jgi:hypothetical protein
MIPKKEQEPRKKMNLRPDRWTGARASLQCDYHWNRIVFVTGLQGHQQKGIFE